MKIAAVLAATALVLASCADDDSGTAGTTAVETTEAAVESTEVPADSEPAADAGTASPVAAVDAWPNRIAPNTTPADDDTAAEWRALAEASLTAAEGTPGMWIAMSDPDLGYWTAALGDAVTDTTAATVEDHGRIGSVTKTFTAVGILLLVDAGELALDDTVADAAPGIAEQFPDVADRTVRELLDMSSGIPDYANAPGTVIAETVANPDKVWTPEELINSALTTSDIRPSGTAGYSTTGYTILGEILADHTDLAVHEAVTAVATEAGLTHTALNAPDDNALPAPSSHGYVEPAGVVDLEEVGTTVEPGTDVTDWSNSSGGAGGGMYSIVDELFTWAGTGSGTTLLSDDLATERLTTSTDLGGIGTYGLGIQEVIPGWIGHEGQVIGWMAVVMYEPATGKTFAAIVNSTGGLTAAQSLFRKTLGQ
jgi:D-alanyl-D-alanine carboxypeptidase